MKFGQPLLTTELSGSMGGATASKARGGIGYFRVRRIPGNPRTFFQSVVRATQASLAAAWRTTLTALQRSDWEGLASSSESGINAYVRAKFQATLIGETSSNAAPVTIALPVIPMAGCIIDASAHTLTFSADMGTVDNVQGNVYTTPPQSASRASQQFDFRLAGTIPGDEQALTLTPTMQGYNGVAGDVIYVKLVRFGQAAGDNENQVATPEIFRVTVVA